MRRLSSQGTQPGRHNDCRGKPSQTYEYAKKAWLKSLSRFTETGRAPEKADVLTQERLPIYIQRQQLDGKRRIRSLNGDSYRYRGDQTCCSALYWIPARLAHRVLAVTHKKKKKNENDFKSEQESAWVKSGLHFFLVASTTCNTDTTVDVLEFDTSGKRIPEKKKNERARLLMKSDNTHSVGWGISNLSSSNLRLAPKSKESL